MRKSTRRRSTLHDSHFKLGLCSELGTAWACRRSHLSRNAQPAVQNPIFRSLAALAVSRIIGLASSCMLAGLMWAFAPFPTPPEWASILSATAAVLLLVAGGTAVVTPFQPPPFGSSMPSSQRYRRISLSRLWLKTINAVLSLFEAVQATATRGAFELMPTHSFGRFQGMPSSPAASRWRHRPVAPPPRGLRSSSPMRHPLQALWSCSCFQAQRSAGMCCLAPPLP